MASSDRSVNHDNQPGVALRLRSWQHLRKLRTINGLSLEQLTQRASPISDNTTDVDWRCRSFDGFLEEDETLQERLEKDWTIVLEELNSTHLAVAELLKEVIREAKLLGTPQATLEFKGAWPTTTHRQGGLFGWINRSRAQQLEVVQQSFIGEQYSLFYPVSLDARPSGEEKAPLDDEESEDLWDGRDEERSKWRVEFTIRNLAAPDLLVLKIGGDDEKGVVGYIEDLGFYEGGLLNEYRIDPHLLRATLCGEVTPQALEILQQRLAAWVALKKREIDRCKSTTTTDERQREEQQAFTALLETKFQEEIKAKETALQRLREQLLGSSSSLRLLTSNPCGNSNRFAEATAIGLLLFGVVCGLAWLHKRRSTFAARPSLD